MAKRVGKITVVSGGTGHLGRAVVLRMIQEGNTVIVPHNGSARSTKFISALPVEFRTVDFRTMNAESETSVQDFFSYVEQHYGTVDVVCSLVGGVVEKKWIDDVTFDEWQRVFSLNVHSCFLAVRESVRIMKKHRYGRIVTIGAKPAMQPEGRRSGYDVAKAAVIALTRSVAAELEEFGDIAIAAIVPNIIATEENKQWGTEEEWATWITPEQIAGKIVDLCAAPGAYVNGTIHQMYDKE